MSRRSFKVWYKVEYNVKHLLSIYFVRALGIPKENGTRSPPLLHTENIVSPSVPRIIGLRYLPSLTARGAVPPLNLAMRLLCAWTLI